jgi:hypothetical protein
LPFKETLIIGVHGRSSSPSSFLAAAIIVLRGHYHRPIHLGLAALQKSNTDRDGGEALPDVKDFPIFISIFYS